MLALLAGCDRPAAPRPRPADPVADLACSLDPDHALRGTCTGADGTLVFSAPGEADRRFVAEGGTTRFWGLVPDTAWTVAVEGGSARTGLRTDPLPDAFLPLRIAPEGAGTVEAFAFPVTCPSSSWVVADERGRVVHYDALPGDRPGPISGFGVTEDRTFLMLVGRSRIVEVAPTGETRLDLARGTDFDDLVHHAVVRRDGRTWALHARVEPGPRADYVADGVYVFEGGALVDDLDTWGLFPLRREPWMEAGYWSTPFPDAVDQAHANGLFVEPGSEALWVSFRHQSALVRFAGRPGRPGFGDVLAIAVGDAGSPAAALADDPAWLAVEGGPTAPFAGQHDPTLEDGFLTLLDNRFPDGSETAEVSRYRLGPGSLALVESWDTGDRCPYEGGARVLPSGNVLSACASAGAVAEWAPGRPEPVWSATVACGSVGLPVPSAVPIALP